MNYFKDTSKNGLQVSTPKREIKKLGYATDATSYIFDLAIENKIDLLLTHHGLFWWYDTPITDVHYQRISKLIKNDIGLFAVHLPLDAHPVVWNNIWLTIGLINTVLPSYDSTLILKSLETKVEEILHAPNATVIFEDEVLSIKKFWNYWWTSIGYGTKFKQNKFHISQIINFTKALQLQKQFLNFWQHETFDSISIVSWGGGDLLQEAKESGYDIFLTWEMAHWQITLAKEIKQSVLLGGHRHTEKIGPKLLANYIAKKFRDVEIIFLDEAY